MKSKIVLILLSLMLIMSTVAFTGCGSSDGGGDSASAALFASNSYVDYTDGELDTTAYYMEASLPLISVNPTAFTGVTAAAIEAAVAGKNYLIIPSQTADMTAMAQTALDAIGAFVNSGGTLVLFGDSSGYDADLINAIFGYNITAGTGCTVDPAVYVALDNTDTIFSGGTGGTNGWIGTTVSCDWTTGIYWNKASLPTGGHSIYDSNDTEVAVAQINQEKGKIIFIAQDFYVSNLLIKTFGMKTDSTIGTNFWVEPVDTLSGVDIEVYGPDGETLIYQGTDVFGTSISLKSGNYAYIKITGNGGSEGAYTAKQWCSMACLTEGPDTAADPDSFEDNDTAATATPLKYNHSKELFMSTGDVDWFKVYYK